MTTPLIRLPEASVKEVHFPELIRSHHMLSAGYPVDTWHSHESYELLLFLSGNADYYVEHHRYHMKHGELLLIRSYDIHRIVVLDNSAYERVATHFSPELLKKLPFSETNLLSCFEEKCGIRKNPLPLNAIQLERYLSLIDQMHTALASDQYGNMLLAWTYLLQILLMVNSLSSNLITPP